MTSKEFAKNYLQLEKQVLQTQRYVDFNAQNNSTYSIEYLQLYLAICSEIDVVAKVIVKETGNDINGDTINFWGLHWIAHCQGYKLNKFFLMMIM